MTRASDTAKLLGAGGSILGSLDIGGGQIGGRRNIIINGAMQVAQRGTSATGLGAETSLLLDRFSFGAGDTAGRATMSQVADVHDGFANALKLDCTTADTSIAANEQAYVIYKFEGQELQQLKKGTSSAEKMTLSFYVKGNAAATYTAEFYDADNNRHIAQEFSVGTDWSRITLTYVGDTAGAYGDDNALSLYLFIWLHAGSNFTSGTFVSNTWASVSNTIRVGDNQTSFFDSTNRTFFLTGVQLELGSVATPFEHRSFGEELHLCKRYYNLLTTGAASKYISMASAYNTAQFTGVIQLNPTMRATPTIDIVTGTNYYRCVVDATNFNFDVLAIDGADNKQVLWAKGGLNSITSGSGGWLQTTNTASYMAFQAEL